jgi:hypothetical protein
MHASNQYLWLADRDEGPSDNPRYYIRYDKSGHSLSKVSLSSADEQHAFADTATFKDDSH